MQLRQSVSRAKGKTALHRQEGRKKDGVREVKKDGLEGRDWTEMAYAPEKHVFKGGGQVVCVQNG